MQDRTINTANVASNPSTLFPRLQTLAARQVITLANAGSLATYTGKNIQTLMREDGLEDALTPELNSLANQFLQYTIWGMQARAESILKDNPAFRPFLLVYKGTVQDLSGRTYKNYTALQLAYAVGDIAIKPEWGREEMCDMLMKYIGSLPEGKEAALSQLKEKENDWSVTQQVTYDFNPLWAVIMRSEASEVNAAIALKEDGSELCEALKDFRAAIAAIMLQEECFNPLHFEAAIGMYTELSCKNVGDWDRRDLFWCLVVGCIEAYLPSCYIQAGATGISGLLRRPQEKLRRSFYAGAHSIFDYDLSALSADNLTKGNIQLSCDNEGLSYYVLGLDGTEKQDIIAWKELPANFPKTVAEILAIKREVLPEVLSWTSLRGHTPLFPLISSSLGRNIAFDAEGRWVARGAHILAFKDYVQEKRKRSANFVRNELDTRMRNSVSLS